MPISALTLVAIEAPDAGLVPVTGVGIPDRLRGEVPDGQALFRAALHRTTRASFDARGSPVIYAV
jgi:hypothetical protein